MHFAVNKGGGFNTLNRTDTASFVFEFHIEFQQFVKMYRVRVILGTELVFSTFKGAFCLGCSRNDWFTTVKAQDFSNLLVRCLKTDSGKTQ